jgi:hypothetical protein
MSAIRVAFLLLPAISALHAQTALRISSAPALPPAIAGTQYYYALSATGGSPPYSWAAVAGSLPTGLNLSPGGTISGSSSSTGSVSLTIQVSDSAGTKVSQAFSQSVLPGATVSRFGVVPQLAAGESWNTSITFLNSSAQDVPIRVNFYGDSGAALALPLVVVQQGSTQTLTSASVETALGPNSTVVISTGALPSTVTGWAEIFSPGPLNGFSVFRNVPASGSASECTVPVQTQTPSSIVLPYDNSTGYVMGVAIANPSPESTQLTATLFDDSGIQLAIQTLRVGPKGHTAFVMPDQMPTTAGRRGIVRFQGTGTGGILAIGLRFSPFGTFTSVPAFERQ